MRFRFFFFIISSMEKGKGLATVAGILGVLNLYVLLVMVLLAGIFALLSRNSGVAAILATIPFALVYGFVTGDWGSLPFTLTMSVIVLVKHRPEEYAETAKFLGLK